MNYSAIKMWPICIYLLFFCSFAFSQDNTTKKDSPGEKIYQTNYWVSGSIAVAGLVSNHFSHDRLRGKPGLAEEHVNLITAKGVNRFDRWSLRQDPSKKDMAEEISDRILFTSVALPFLLFLDEEIRKDWFGISLMYAETQALNSIIYGWSPLGPSFIERYRPVVYYEELPLPERNFGNLRNSFFSGHVGTTATATFFAAKVFSDYHPGLGGKKFVLFGLAALPPAIAGYYRIKALKHFPTDVIAGGIIGASLGMLIPELHRLARKRVHLSVIYNEKAKGLGVSYRL